MLAPSPGHYDITPSCLPLDIDFPFDVSECTSEKGPYSTSRSLRRQYSFR